MHGADGIALLLFLIVAALAASHYLNKKRIFWLPSCGATILIGVAAGLLIYNLSEDHHEADFLEFDPENFTLFLLPPIIFEAGYHLNMRLFRRKLSSILSLAVVGTLVATGMTWYALLRYAKPPQSTWDGFDVAEAGQFAALISAVDPVATLAVFGSLRVDHELQVVVLGESVLNDAIALIAYRAIGQYGSTLHTEWRSVIVSFCKIALGSLVTGTACGALAALALKVMKSGRSKEVPQIEAGIFLCFAYGSFVIAEVPHWSGIVASLFAGVAMRRYARPNLSDVGRAHVDVMLTVLVALCDTIIYIYVGFALVVDVQVCLREQQEPCLYVFGFVMLIGMLSRAAHLYPLLGLCNLCSAADNRVPLGYQTVVWWGGLRGAIAVALAVQLTGRHASLIRAVTMLVVVTTTFVLGGTTKTALDIFSVPTGVADDPGEEAERRVGLGNKSFAQAVDEAAAELLLDHELNKLCNDNDFEDIGVGETVLHNNPYFSDGTRLRLGPQDDVAFSGHILNDTMCDVLDIGPKAMYALVRSCDAIAPAEGWVRRRNLTRLKPGQEEGASKRLVRDEATLPPSQRLPRPASQMHQGATVGMPPAAGAGASIAHEKAVASGGEAPARGAPKSARGGPETKSPPMHARPNSARPASGGKGRLSRQTPFAPSTAPTEIQREVAELAASTRNLSRLEGELRAAERTKGGTSTSTSARARTGVRSWPEQTSEHIRASAANRAGQKARACPPLV